jgi:hypothetical protein
VPAPAPARPARRGHLVPAPVFSLGTERTLAAYLQLPWDVVTQQKRFTTTPPALINPLFVGALLGAWGARRRRWPVMLAGVMVAGFAFWAIGYPDIRYYLPYIPLWCLLAGGGLGGLLALPRIGGTLVLVASSTVVLGLGVLDMAAILYHNQDLARPLPDAVAVAVGLQPRQGYLQRHISDERAVEYVNAHVPADARVLFLWTDRIFWARPWAIPDQGGGAFTALLAADDQARRTHRPFTLPDGATYLLASREIATYDRANGWLLDPGIAAQYAALDALASRRLVRLYSDESFAVYRVRQPAPGRS